MDYNKRIRELREKAHLTQDRLAEIMGLETPNFISQIETGRKKVGLSVITKFCKALGMEISEFFSEAAPQADPSKTIPLIELAVAEVDKLYDSSFRVRVSGLCRIEKPPDLQDEEAYAAVVSGDSMSPALKDKDVVIVSPSQKYKDNDMAIVGMERREVLLRRVRDMGEMLLLDSCNPNVESRLVKRKDVSFIHPVLWVRYKMPLSLMPGC